jgi:hypothetical protein
MTSSASRTRSAAESHRSAARTPDAAHAAPEFAHLLDLQGTAGNGAVTGLLGSAGALSGRGDPLPRQLRHRLEAAFTAPLGHVRLHSGPDAARMAAALDARAFTVGEHIGFPAKGLSPDSPDGYRLLAHEVAHVVQQGPRPGGSARLTRRDDAAESAASAAADRVAAGGTAGPIGTSAGPILARDGWQDAVEWLGDKAKAGKEAGYEWLIAQLRNLHKAGISRLRAYGAGLTGLSRAEYDGIVATVDLTLTILEGLVYAVVGISAGFITGILQMVVGFLRLAVGVAEGIFAWLYGFIDGGKEFDRWAGEVKRTISLVPVGLRMLISDWLTEFEKASPEKSGIMIGELTGQILAFIATLGISAGKAGSVAQSAKLAPRLAQLIEKAPQAVATTTGITVPAAVEASPRAVAIADAAVRHGVAATAAGGTTSLQMAGLTSGGGAGGGGAGGGGAGGGRRGGGGTRGGGSRGGERSPAAKKPAAKAPEPKATEPGGPSPGEAGAETGADVGTAAEQYRDNLVKRFPKLAEANLRPARRPRGVPGTWEESVYTGSGRQSWNAELRRTGPEVGPEVKAKKIQLDDIDPHGRLVDTKMRGIDFGREIPPDVTPDLLQEIGERAAAPGWKYELFSPKDQAQLIRQLRFAKENDLAGVRWETNSSEYKAEVDRYARTILSADEASRLEVVVVER